MGASGFSTDDALDLLYQVMPRGFVRWMGGWDRNGDIFKYYAGISDTLLEYCYDIIASLRTETVPNTATQKLPDYETALGLTTTHAALFGSIADRRAGIISKYRESGQFKNANVQAILAPLLGYVDPNALVVVETSRAGMTAAHTYTTAPNVAIPDNDVNGVISKQNVPDGGYVSRAGVQLTVRLTHTAVQQISVTLLSPDSKVSKTWANFGTGSVTNQDYLLYGVEFAGTSALDTWALTVVDTGAGNTGTLKQWSLFVDGDGTYGLGGDLVDWAVYADPNLVGQTGVAADVNATLSAIERIKHAYTRGHVLLSLVAHPDDATGTYAAIPDACIPV